MAIGDQDCGRVMVAVPGMLAGGILETVHFLRGRDGCAEFSQEMPLWKATFRITHFLRRVVNFSPGPSRRNFVARGVTEYWIGTAASFRLDVGGPDHLGPLLGGVHRPLPKLGRN